MPGRPDAEPEEPVRPARAVPLLRDFVEGEWKEAHFDRYKPSTRRGVEIRLASRILPAFGGKPLDRIAPAQVRRWFDAWSRTAPGSANKGLELLRQIVNFAIARGYVEKNPARGIRPNRRPKLTRFLSREEIARLHRALDGRIPRSGPPAGGHRPASPADRMPPGRDRRAPVVGGRRGRADAGR